MPRIRIAMAASLSLDRSNAGGNARGAVVCRLRSAGGWGRGGCVADVAGGEDGACALERFGAACAQPEGDGAEEGDPADDDPGEPGVGRVGLLEDLLDQEDDHEGGAEEGQRDMADDVEAARAAEEGNRGQVGED